MRFAGVYNMEKRRSHFKLVTLNLSLLFFSTFFLFACTTVEFVRKDLTPQKKAVVRYSPSSSVDTEAKHREELKKQALSFCGGDYEITKEYQAKDETGTSTGLGTDFGVGAGSSIFIGGSRGNTAMYNFVEFSCK